jgi:RecB family exonuclease
MAVLAEDVFEKYKNLKVAGLEERFEIKLDSVKLPIVGYIDLRTSEGTVIDWKTGAKSPSANSADVSEQLTLYDLATRKVHGITPPRMGNIFARMGANGPIIKEFWTEPRSQEDFDRLENRFGILDKAIENKGPWHPAPAGAWWCAEARCPFYKDCKVRA